MIANTPDSSTLADSTLVVFCRRPVLGVGKQRIAGEIGAESTLVLAQHLLAATLEDAAAWPGAVILAPATAADATWAGELLARQSQVIPQPEGNLGRRINVIDELARDAGHTRLIYVGSDAPILDDTYYAGAPAALATHDAVLGPADDGGVTLMGARRGWPDLEGLPWSSPDLGKALELTCIQKGLTVYSLERRYDIDLAADLPRLYEDLCADSRPARQKLRQWLADVELTNS